MEVVAKLTVSGDLHTGEELQKRLRLQADKIWDKGDVRAPSKIIEKRSGLSMELRMEPQGDINVPLRLLLERLKKSTLAASTTRGELCIQTKVTCAVYCASTPALYIESDVIEQIAAIGADFDIDLYLIEQRN